MTVDRAVAREIATSLVGTFKALSAHKRRLPRPHPHAEQGSLPLLYALAAEPLRVSALAEAVHSDVSTVSRQVSALSGGGLVAKIQDPEDGRAQLVSLTDEGIALIEDMRERRARWVQSLLSNWSSDEALEFERLLTKFSDSLDAYQAPATDTASPTTDSSRRNDT